MKTIWGIIPAFLKAIISVFVFIASLGWASYGAILMIVKAEGKEIRREVMEVRRIDIEHIDKRFDKLEALIRDNK